MTVWGLGWSSENDQFVALNPGGSLTLSDGAGNQINFFRVSASTAFPVYASRINYYSTMTAVSAVNGVPSSLSLRDPDGTTRLFSAAEAPSLLRLALLTDRNGNTVAYSRDSQGRLTKVTDVHGRYFAYAYNSAGLVATLTDSGGRTSSYSYDAQGHRTGETGPLGATFYAYDSKNRMTRINYPNGGVKNYAYDAKNRVAAEDDGNGNDLLSYAYGDSTTTVTDALGRAAVYRYVTIQGLKKESSITDPAGGVTSFTYDSNLNLASQTDPLGNVTRYTYDAAGNVTATQDAAGGSSLASYEPIFNNPTSITDSLNHTTNMSYDGQGDLIRIQDALSGVTSKNYDSQGHVTQSQDPLGFATSFSYDQLGALASVTDPVNRKTAMINDALSRVVKNTDPAGKATQYAYDQAGNLLQATDALGNVTKYAYAPGRQAKLLGTVTDALGHTTTFGYDDLGRQTSVTNALGQSKTMTYDAKGNLISMKNARGQTITYAYDSLDRLTTKTLPEGTIHYAYDAAGNLTNVTHYNGSAIQNTYDSLNRLTQQVQTLPNGFQATIGYGYDAAGNRTSMTTPWGNFSYTYDALNRLTSITNPQNKVFSFAYDADGRRASLSYPNGIVTTYTYDHSGQVLSITATRTSDGVVVSSEGYTYDPSGNRTSMTDWAGTHTYSYDNLNRLIAANHPAASQLPILNETFSYDGVGNRSADVAISGYQYDAANRLTQNSQFNYNYDADGNQLAAGATSFAYSAENQLKEVDLPDGAKSIYKYDDQNNRIVQSTGSPASPTLSRFIFDGQKILAALDGNNSLVEIFTNGSKIDEPLGMHKGDGTDFYIHADALGSVAAHTEAGAVLVEDVAYEVYGQAVFIDQRGPPPNPAASSLTGDFYALTARQLDSETGRYYFRNRQGYDPLTGRFGQRDPLEFGGRVNLFVNSGRAGKPPQGIFYEYSDILGRPEQRPFHDLAAGVRGSANNYQSSDSVGKPPEVNAYDYALNNPVKYIDPMGAAVCFNFNPTNLTTPLWFCVSDSDPSIDGWYLIPDLPFVFPLWYVPNARLKFAVPMRNPRCKPI